jgi:hypothetical protein
LASTRSSKRTVIGSISLAANQRRQADACSAARLASAWIWSKSNCSAPVVARLRGLRPGDGLSDDVLAPEEHEPRSREGLLEQETVARDLVAEGLSQPFEQWLRVRPHERRGEDAVLGRAGVENARQVSVEVSDTPAAPIGVFRGGLEVFVRATGDPGAGKQARQEPRAAALNAADEVGTARRSWALGQRRLEHPARVVLN